MNLPQKSSDKGKKSDRDEGSQEASEAAITTGIEALSLSTTACTLFDHLPSQPAGSFTSTATNTRPLRNSSLGCGICGLKGFVNFTKFRDHYRLHTGIRPFRCTFPKCEGVLASEIATLKEHFKSAHNWNGMQKLMFSDFCVRETEAEEIERLKPELAYFAFYQARDSPLYSVDLRFKEKKPRV